MKRSILLVSAILVCALVGAATEPPRYEAFLGYTYVRANQFNQNPGLGTAIGGYDMNGGTGQFIYNFNNWISAVGDFGAVYKPNVGIINVTNTTAFTLAGPRFNWRTHRFHKLTPYGQVLFGASYRHVSTSVNAITGPNTPILAVANPANLFPGPLAPVTARLTASQNAFTMFAGGGLDYRFNKHFTARCVEVDYVLTRFPSLETGFRENQNSIAASIGVVFTFGAM